MRRLATVREIQTEVRAAGNGAHITVPKDWIGRKVKVLLEE